MASHFFNELSHKTVQDVLKERPRSVKVIEVVGGFLAFDSHSDIVEWEDYTR